MITALKAKAHSMWKSLFSCACCSSTPGWQRYLFSRGLSLSFCLCWAGSQQVLLPLGTVLGDLFDIGSRRLGGVISSWKAMYKNISCHKSYFVLLSWPCGKKRTASDRCQTNLPLLTCAANVEPNDPDLDGNHCKYFPARPVEEAFSRASHWGI